MTDKSKRVETFINNPKKAVWTLTLPMLLGMIVQYLYSLTDTFFVSKISTDAIAAMQFNLPFVFGSPGQARINLESVVLR